ARSRRRGPCGRPRARPAGGSRRSRRDPRRRGAWPTDPGSLTGDDPAGSPNIHQHVPDVTTASAQRTVRRFELLRELGRGATSVVYVARQMDLDRVVAVKELAVLRSTDPNLTERFLRESRLAGSLAHPNVVTVYEYFEDAGTPYIAMEYLERGS